ncbi:NADH-ubiquinone oxidoreductase-F iron-sulfur binding region domain-containing protein [Patescibacteria group bacterium]
MPKKNTISELKKSGLVGRSGSGFPTYMKWQLTIKAPGNERIIICNASEGEPGAHKDEYILKHHPEKVIKGMQIALRTIPKSRAIIYLKAKYFPKYAPALKRLARGKKIEFFEKTGGYLAGEETTLIQAIEGNRIEPSLKPPYPCDCGLDDKPTLVNNVETFYRVAEIMSGKYENKRYYSISGDIKKPGVYDLPENWNIGKILRETGNVPDVGFFVQAGGGASGEILLDSELNQKIKGIGVIIVHKKSRIAPWKLLKEWSDFYLYENCDKCTPCREGVYRISEMVEKKKIRKDDAREIINVLKETSFCPLGEGVGIAYESLFDRWNEVQK